MSVRINQEELAVATSGLTGGGNVRVDQMEEVIGTSGITGSGNVRVNQELMILGIPVGQSGIQVEFIGW